MTYIIFFLIKIKNKNKLKLKIKTYLNEELMLNSYQLKILHDIFHKPNFKKKIVKIKLF